MARTSQRTVGYGLLALAAAGLLAVTVGVVSAGDLDGEGRPGPREEVVGDYCALGRESARVAQDLALAPAERAARLRELAEQVQELAPPDVRELQAEIAALAPSATEDPSDEAELRRLLAELRERTEALCGSAPGPVLVTPGG